METHSSESGPRELSRKTLRAGKFIKYQEILWQGADGTERVWETVERIVGADAVLLIPWLRPSNTLVLIRQFRPPARGTVIEFPAGLIDEDETPEQAAHRELREETGYQGKILRVIPPSYNTPGLSGETVFTVFLDINEALPENIHPVAQLDDGEHIEVILLKRKAVPKFLNDELQAGSQFDSKVMSYLLGMLTEKELSSKEGDWLSRFFGGM